MIFVLLSTALAAEPVDVEALLRESDDLTRGTSSRAVIEMHVKTANYERTMRMEAWSQGTDKTLIKLLAPEKDAGIATLKVDDNIWNYLPKVDRTMKVPAGMMSGAWMGSHFSNDDLVRESRFSDDFTWTVVESPDTGTKYVIDLVPKPDAPVVWGKIRAVIGADRLPIETVFYDEKGAVARTMTYTDVKTIDGRAIPARMRMIPGDKPEEFTEITYLELDFDAAVPPEKFTLQGLK
jgi:hypothetical protein